MMQSFYPGQVVLMELPFTSGIEAKRRPTLVLLDTGDADVIVVPITSRTGRSAFDVVLVDWQEAGLMMPSTVRVHKPTTIAKRLSERVLGRLTPADWAKVRVKTQELWATI
jgi:mRNA interferase MazF